LLISWGEEKRRAKPSRKNKKARSCNRFMGNNERKDLRRGVIKRVTEIQGSRVRRD